MKLKKILLPIVMLTILFGAFVVPMFIVPEAKEQGKALGTFVSSKADKRPSITPMAPRTSAELESDDLFFGDAVAKSDVNLDGFFTQLNAHEFEKAAAFLQANASKLSPNLASNLNATLAARRSEKGALKRTLDESKTLLAELRNLKKQGPAAIKRGPIPKGNAISFGVDSSVVEASAVKSLVTPAKTLKSRPDLRIMLRGYSDSTGDAKYNAILAEARCEAVRDILVEQGAPSARIRVLAFGESQNAKQNLRKVEIVFEHSVQVTQSSSEG